MSKYDISKYTFVEVPAKMDEFGDLIAGPQVVAISTFAGQKIRGVAKCHPNDIESYSFAEGCELAAARCAYKIAQKRLKRALRKYKEAQDICNRADEHFAQMADYLNRAGQEMGDCLEELKALET